MKQLVLSLSLVIITTLTFAQENPPAQSESGIKWMSWDEMIAAQQVERKKVFMDIYTDWCGWCKKMDASTFKDPSIVSYMNQNYYAVKLDAEMKEDIEFNNYKFINPNPGQKRSTHQLAVSLLDGKLSYPSFVILDENVSRQHIIKGFQQPETLMGILLFFKTNEFVRYKQYLDQQQKIRQAQQQQQLQQQQSQQVTNSTP